MQNPIHSAGASHVPMDERPAVWKSGKSNEAPIRKRNPLACEWCYKKKIRCEVEGSNTACVQCIRRNINCKFTSRKEKREALKRTQYVKALEERLKRTETLLRAAGILDEASIGQEELHDEDDDLESESEVECEDEEDSVSPNLSRKDGQAKTHKPTSISTAKLSDNIDSSASSDIPGRRHPTHCKSDYQQIPVFKLDHREESRYYGRASSLSILSREGIEWIKNKTGDTRFLNYLCSYSSHDSPWDYWRADVFHDLFACKVFRPLPSRAEVFSLVKDFFNTSNRLFPVFHEGTFMQLLEWQYTQQTCTDAAWWAAINIILALAYEYRISDSIKPEKDRERAWLYFKNAMSVFSELTMRRTDLLSVQALLGLAIFLRGNSGTQSALPVLTAAMRSCHRMGLHRDIPRPHLQRVEVEQRRRVFWIAYVLDQSMCVRAGSSPVQNVDDFDVGLPEVDEHHPPFFRQLCCLTVIKSRIYGKLYSTKGLQRTPEEVCQMVKDLHAELEEWKNENPFDNSFLHQAEGDGFLLGFASVGLQFVYYNSLIMTHRVPLLLHYYAHRVGSETQFHFDPAWFGEQSKESAIVCVQAARDTLKLVNSMPWGDIAWIWSLLYYIFLAVMTLFVNILRDSKQPNVREDLQSLNMAATFFTTLIPGDGPYNYAKFMARMCTNFERIARTVVERSEKAIKTRPDSTEKPPHHSPGEQGQGHGKRTQHNREPQHQKPSKTSVIPDLIPQPVDSNYIISEPTTTNNTILASNPPPINTNTTTPLDTMFPTTTPQNPTPTNPTQNPTTPWPDFWQIPLTADWEFGNQFLTGLFASDYSTTANTYHPSSSANTNASHNPFLPTTITNMPMPMSLSMSMNDQQQAAGMGYFFGQSGQSGQMWSGGGFSGF